MMRFTHLKTHWTHEDAHAILSLLDELRDALWSTYGQDIIENQRQEFQHNGTLNEDEYQKNSSDDDDLIPF